MKIFKMMTQRKNKDGKNFYQEIGTMFAGEYEGKPSLSGYLNTNPDVKVYFFEQKPKEQNTVGGINFDDASGGSDNVPF
jgi:hypothetical protein